MTVLHSTISIMQKCKSWGTCWWKFLFPLRFTAEKEPILQGELQVAEGNVVHATAEIPAELMSCYFEMLVFSIG